MIGFLSRLCGGEGVIDEMRMFPNGRHDDRIDGLSRAYSQLIDSTFSYNNV